MIDDQARKRRATHLFSFDKNLQKHFYDFVSDAV